MRHPWRDTRQAIEIAATEVAHTAQTLRLIAVILIVAVVGSLVCLILSK